MLGKCGCYEESLRGEARAQNGFEDEDVFFVIVGLGLRDLRGCAAGLDTMQFREFGRGDG